MEFCFEGSLGIWAIQKSLNSETTNISPYDVEKNVLQKTV